MEEKMIINDYEWNDEIGADIELILAIKGELTLKDLQEILYRHGQSTTPKRLRGEINNVC